MTTAPAPTFGQAQGEQAPSIDAAHAELLLDRSLQFEMQPIEPPEMPTWLEPLLAFLQAIGPLMVWVFWIGVAVVALIILYLIGTEIMRRLPDRNADKTAAAEAKPEYRPAVSRAKALLEEADRLAAQGKFSEAARVLLHRSIEDLEQVFTMTIGLDLTSREISQLEPLSGEGRNVFTRIARAVEVSLFGGRTLNADDYKSCRDAYANFALAGARR